MPYKDKVAITPMRFGPPLELWNFRFEYQCWGRLRVAQQRRPCGKGAGLRQTTPWPLQLPLAEKERAQNIRSLQNSRTRAVKMSRLLLLCDARRHVEHAAGSLFMFGGSNPTGLT